MASVVTFGTCRKAEVSDHIRGSSDLPSLPFLLLLFPADPDQSSGLILILR